MIDSSSTTYSERRLIRERLQREEVEGVSLDPATKCICPNCNQVHYKRKVKDATSNTDTQRQE